jgi:hypothetical protein
MITVYGGFTALNTAKPPQSTITARLLVEDLSHPAGAGVS